MERCIMCVCVCVCECVKNIPMHEPPMICFHLIYLIQLNSSIIFMVLTSLGIFMYGCFIFRLRNYVYFYFIVILNLLTLNFVEKVFRTKSKLCHVIKLCN